MYFLMVLEARNSKIKGPAPGESIILWRKEKEGQRESNGRSHNSKLFLIVFNPFMQPSQSIASL
jgi:hypothetical protein